MNKGEVNPPRPSHGKLRKRSLPQLNPEDAARRLRAVYALPRVRVVFSFVKLRGMGKTLLSRVFPNPK